MKDNALSIKKCKKLLSHMIKKIERGGSFRKEGEVLLALEALNPRDTCSMVLVPIMMKYLELKTCAHYFEVTKVIISFLGEMNPDGVIAEHLFSLKGLNSGKIIEALRVRGYLGLRYFLPAFAPHQKNFVLNLGQPFEKHSKIILEILMEAAGNTQVLVRLLELFEDKEMKEYIPHICNALKNIGNPLAVASLKDKWKEGYFEALEAIIIIFQKDLNAFEQLSASGIEVDMWGNNLEEKVLEPIKKNVPLLSEIINSKKASSELKNAGVQVLSFLGLKEKSIILLILTAMEDLISEHPQKCLFTQAIIRIGAPGISVIEEFLKDNMTNPVLVERLIYVLENLKSEHPPAERILKDLEMNHPVLIRHTHEVPTAEGSLKEISDAFIDKIPEEEIVIEDEDFFIASGAGNTDLKNSDLVEQVAPVEEFSDIEIEEDLVVEEFSDIEIEEDLVVEEFPPIEMEEKVLVAEYVTSLDKKESPIETSEEQMVGDPANKREPVIMILDEEEDEDFSLDPEEYVFY